MEINTASALISFVRKLEEESAGFYEELSQRCVRDKDTFLAFTKENGKNIVQVERIPRYPKRQTAPKFYDK